MNASGRELLRSNSKMYRLKRKVRPRSNDGMRVHAAARREAIFEATLIKNFTRPEPLGIILRTQMVLASTSGINRRDLVSVSFIAIDVP